MAPPDRVANRGVRSPGRGAILGGLVALVFFLAEVVASVLDHNDLGAIPAATSQIDQSRLTRPGRGDADPQGQTESIGIGFEADHARHSDFQSLPWVQLGRLP